MKPQYDYLFYDLRVAEIPPLAMTKAWLGEILGFLGFRNLGVVSTQFESPVPGQEAYTLAVVLSESHAVIHTAPEHGWVHVAFATCGALNREATDELVTGFFKPKVVEICTRASGVPS